MKKVISFVLMLCLFSNVAFADSCDWTQIKKMPNGDYAYSPALNICVGQLVQTNQTQTQQIQDYQKAVALKDLAVKYDDDRVALWQKSADDELNKANSIASLQSHSDWMYFGLGVLTTFAAAYGASKLVAR